MKRYLVGHAAVGLAVMALGGAVVGIGLALLVGSRPALYTASAEVRLVVNAQADQSLDAVRSALLQARALAELAVTPIELRRIGQSLNPPASGAELADSIRARAEPDLLLIRFDARAESAERASAIANLTMDNLLSRAMPLLSGGDVTLEPMQSATPTARPSYPYLVRDIAVGSLGGAALSIAVGLAVIGQTRTGSGGGTNTRSPVSSHIRSVSRPRAAVAFRSPTLIGAAFGLAILAAMGLGLPPLVLQALGAVAAIAAALSPGTGLAIIATIIVMPEPPGFTPIGLAPILIAATAYGLVIDAIGARRQIAVTPLGVLAAGFLAISAVDTVPLLSGLGPERTGDALFRLIQAGSGIVLLASAWVYFSRNDPRPHLVVAGAAAGAAAALGIMQFSASNIQSLPLAGLIYDPVGADTVTRATGPFVNPNYFGFLCGLAMVLVLGLLPVLPRMRVGLLVLLGALAGGLAVSFSRGALLSVVAGLIVIVWLRSRVAGGVLAVVLAIAAIGLYPVFLEVREAPDGSSVSTVAEGVSESDSLRLAAVQSAIPMFLTNPLSGVGFGQYRSEAEWFVGSSPVTSSHSEFFSILAEQGMAGSVIFAAAVFLVLRRIARSRGPLRDLVTGVLVAFAVSWLSLEPLSSLQTSGLVWLVLAAIASPMVEGSRDADRPAAELSPATRRRLVFRRVTDAGG